MSDTRLIRCDNCGAKNRALIDRAAVCGKCRSKLTVSDKVFIATDSNFAEITESARPVLLDLWAEWCPPCRMLAPTIESLAQELAGLITVAKLNVDENPVSAGRFSVKSIPTILVLKRGKEVARIVGLQSKEAILGQLQPFV